MILKFKYFTGNSLLLSILLSTHIFCQSEIINVVPEPQQYHFINAKFMLNNSSFAIKTYIKKNEPVEIALKELKGIFVQDHKITFNQNSSRKILIGLTEEDKNFKQILENEELLLNEKP